ncbi:MAG: glycosyl hydrolase, partial [Gemmatimonadota bacterium]
MIRLGCLLALALLLPAPAVRAQQPIERLFYYVDQEPAWESLVEHIDRIDIVAPGAYNVDRNGVVW